MDKRGAPRPERRYKGRPRPADDATLAATLEDVRRIIGVDSEPVAKVLPEAVARATEERGPALAAALEPTITRTIRSVASRESEWFGEILSPTIGVAVRKAVAAAFAAIMQRVDELMERSLSVRAIQWRLEALRTGRPFSEIVLSRTLIYRVEQVFLIHSQTGLVLQHVVAEGAPSADPDQVASMISAIDTFGKEAFVPDFAGAYLHEFALGDVTVWVERGAMVALALVVRGIAPRALRNLMAETRERIVLEQREKLESFVADIGPFVATRPLLEQCLLEQRTAAARRSRVLLGVLGLAMVVVVAVLVAEHQRSAAGERHLAVYRAALEAEPGIVVSSAERNDDRYILRGFRDPAAASPAELAARLGHPPVDLAFELFYSLEAPIVERRFRALAGAPPGVRVKLDDGSLQLSGEAPRAWIDQALALAAATPGIEHVDNAVLDSSAAELERTIAELEATVVSFEPGSSELAPAELPVIERAATLIDRVRFLWSESDQQGCVVAVGDADKTGSDRGNARLASERGRTVVGALRWIDPSLTPDVTRARGRHVLEDGPHTRSARFDVHAGHDAIRARCWEASP